MKDNIAPEERLLRLIRGKKQDIVSDKKPITTHQISEVKPHIKSPIFPLIQKYFSFLYLRKIIRVAFALSCLYLIVSFIYPSVGLQKVKLPDIPQEKITETKIEAKIEAKPYEFYLEGIKNRRIFSSAFSQETQKPTSNVTADLMKDINLIGIISGDNPQAVIEDKKTQKTYYLNKGQFIGELQIEDIQEGKIILDYKGQKYELYL